MITIVVLVWVTLWPHKVVIVGITVCCGATGNSVVGAHLKW